MATTSRSKQLSAIKKQAEKVQSTFNAVKDKMSASDIKKASSGIQSATNTLRSKSGSSSGSRINDAYNKALAEKNAPTITPESLTKTEVANIPTPTVPVTPGLDLKLNNAALGAGTDGLFKIAPIASQPGDSEGVTAAKDSSNVLAQYLEQAMGIARPDAGATERALRDARRQAGVDQAQEEFNRYSNQINAIVAQRDADQLSLEGQGRGITDVIIGGQQAKIAREAAIQALPIQAQLAAAQGNLEQAKELMGQLFTAKSADIQANQAYRTNLASSVMQWASASQQAILQAKQADIAERSQIAQANLAYQRELGLQALEYGQNNLITGIAGVDPSSPTFEQDIARFTAQLRKPVSGGGISAPTIKTINGVDYQWNPTTGQWELPTGVAGAGADDTELQNTLANFDFLRDTARQVIDLSGGASPNPVAEFLRKSIGSSSTKNTQLQGYVDTLRANMLTLATDPNIKQFFGPQMSDADVRLMTAAGSNLRPDEQTPAQLRQEAERIDDWINRAQTAVREGARGNNFGPTTITAPDGTLIEIID